MSAHIRGLWKIDCGLIINAILIPGFFYSFWVALNLKFDGMIHTSLFVLLIPLWTIAIPLFIFTIFNGLATTNSRANKFEKVFLSTLVPSKLF